MIKLTTLVNKIHIGCYNKKISHKKTGGGIYI